MTDQATDNKPFLRALKCAYKLHKAGLTPFEVSSYLIECTTIKELPSASTPPADLLPASFNFSDTTNGAEFWQALQDKYFNNRQVPA